MISNENGGQTEYSNGEGEGSIETGEGSGRAYP